jgi:hypothetical protein
MAIWEYNILVTVIRTLWKPDMGKIWGDKGPDGKTDWDRVQRLGEEGWELVNCFPVASGEGGTAEVAWVFKRQRAER